LNCTREKSESEWRGIHNLKSILLLISFVGATRFRFVDLPHLPWLCVEFWNFFAEREKKRFSIEGLGSTQNTKRKKEKERVGAVA